MLSSILIVIITNAIWISGMAIVFADANSIYYSVQTTKKTPFAHIKITYTYIKHKNSSKFGTILILCGIFITCFTSPVECLLWGSLCILVLFGWFYSHHPSKSLPKQTILNQPPKPNKHNRIGQLLEYTRPFWAIISILLFILAEGHFVIYGIATFIFAWIIIGITSGIWWRNSPVDWALGLLLLMSLGGLFVTSNPSLTLQYWGYFLAQLVAFSTVWVWAYTEERVKFICLGLVITGTVLALLTPLTLRQNNLRFIPHFQLINYFTSSAFEVFQKNILGGALAVILPLALGFALSLKRGKYHFNLAQIVMGLAIILILLALILTQSRGAYLGTVVALVMMISLAAKIQIKKAIAGSVALFSLVGLYLAWTNQLAPVFNHLLQSDILGGIDGRIEIWSRAVYELQDFTFTGIGLGSFSKVTPVFYPFVLAGGDSVPHAHNLFLQAGVDLGIPGLIALLSLLGYLFIVGTKFCYWKGDQKKTFATDNLKWILLGCFGSLCTMLTHGLLDAVGWGTKPAFLSWAALGLLLAVISIQEANTTTPNSIPI